MSWDKLNLILEKLEGIAERLDNIEAGLKPKEEVSITEIGQSDNREKIKEIKKQFQEEIELKKAQKEKREQKKLKQLLDASKDSLIISNERLPEIWSNILEILKDSIAEPSLETWFLKIEPIKFMGDRLIIKTPNEFTKDWLETRYLDMLERIIYQLTDEEIRFKFI